MGAGQVSLDAYRALAGAQLGSSGWYTIDQSRIDVFAEVTEDHQYIHVDPEAAKASPFGGTIAHGFLTLGMLSALAATVLPTPAGAKAGMNFGFNSLRFVAPVPSGGRIRGHFGLKAVADRSPGLLQSTLGVSIEIDGVAKPALVAEWLVLHQF
jgi:acyl dehydratase